MAGRASLRQLDAEVRGELRNAGIDPRRATVQLHEPLDREHARNSRRYAQVVPEDMQFEFATATLDLDDAHRRAVVAHEVGHVIEYRRKGRHSEADADRAAERELGVPICYDRRWPGKGLQVDCRARAKNPRRRSRKPLPIARIAWDVDEEIVWLASPFPMTKKKIPWVKNREIEGAPIEIVQLEELRGTQPDVTQRGVERYTDTPPGCAPRSEDECPVVLRTPTGEMLIQDGHHRLAAAWLRGDETATVRVVDTGGAMANPKRANPKRRTAAKGSKTTWVRVPGGWLREGMIVKAPKWVIDYDPDRGRVDPRDPHGGVKVPWKEFWGQGKPPKYLLVDYWGEGNVDPRRDDGESALYALNDDFTEARPPGVVDQNTADYPGEWLVDVDSIDMDDETRAATLRQGTYPPDYDENPRRRGRRRNPKHAPFTPDEVENVRADVQSCVGQVADRRKLAVKYDEAAPTETTIPVRFKMSRRSAQQSDLFGNPAADPLRKFRESYQTNEDVFDTGEPVPWPVGTVVEHLDRTGYHDSGLVVAHPTFLGVSWRGDRHVGVHTGWSYFYFPESEFTGQIRKPTDQRTRDAIAKAKRAAPKKNARRQNPRSARGQWRETPVASIKRAIGRANGLMHTATKQSGEHKADSLDMAGRFLDDARDQIKQSGASKAVKSDLQEADRELARMRRANPKRRRNATVMVGEVVAVELDEDDLAALEAEAERGGVNGVNPSTRTRRISNRISNGGF